jgi:hypothetical protein
MARRQTVRLIGAIGVVAIMAFVWMDPCTRYASAGDLRVPGPVWQTIAAALEIALLGWVGVEALRERFLRAATLLLVEMMWTLVFNVVLVQTYGLERFIGGVGASELVSRFLLLLVLRVVLVITLNAGARLAPNGS